MRENDLDTIEQNRFARDFSQIPIYGTASAMLQRKCACGGGCPKCQDEKQSDKRLQKKSGRQNNLNENGVPPIVSEVLNSSGQPLAVSTQKFMESRFNHDFSHVRVHTDAKATESAAAVNALAYTVGQNIVFGAGQYSPQTLSGKRLLAHELTHTTQQSGYQNKLQKYSIGGIDDADEREAEQKAGDVVSHQPEQANSLPDTTGGCKNGKWEFQYDGCTMPRNLARAFNIDKDNPGGGADTEFAKGYSSAEGGKACDRHDECYQTYSPPQDKKDKYDMNWKDTCDKVFLEEMLAACDASEEKLAVKVRCKRWAQRYYTIGLRQPWGRKAFRDRQYEVGKCIGKIPDTDKPESDNESGEN